MQKTPKIILGIDPGTLIMGYSIIAIHNGAITIKLLDVLKLSSKKDNYQRLQEIHARVLELVSLYHPTEFAIEAPFFGKNVQSMLKLGRAQGVAIAAALSSTIPITEYSPKKIKQAITGNGNANKEQVWKMLQTITLLPDKPRYFDATDALAVAVCHHFQGKIQGLEKSTPAVKKKKASWEQFVTDNPKRIIIPQ